MPADTTARLIPEAETAAIRCYGQGLGDCFLLAFPRAATPKEPCYVVIDCGIAKGTPDEAERMQTIVRDIHAATGGRLDMLAVTHQHYDHVIGFAHAEAIWKTFTVAHVYLPWTEKPNDPDAATLVKAAMRLNRAAHHAAERAADRTGAANGSGLRLSDGLLAVGSESFGIGAAEGIERGMQIAIERCPAERRVYCEPGDVLPLADTGVHAYVLGPPRYKNRDGKELVSARNRPLVRLLEDPDEMYSYAQLDLAPDGAAAAEGGAAHGAALSASVGDSATSALASALLGSGPDGDEDFDRYCPFDPTTQIALEDALQLPFFQAHYSGDQDWRRVDDDWLDEASSLALRAGNLINNISLVLAFELPQTGKMLLFVGDAQVGNWLSWHRIGRWHPAEGASRPSGPADMDDLLSRVAFYKVGHHGSHNATIRAQGLEKMPDGLLAYIPVSVPVAHDIMGYCPMPFYPVLRALQRKTGGAVFLANGALLEPLPDGANRHTLESAAQQSAATLDAKIRNRGTAAEETLERAVPLWLQFAISDRIAR